ncbi:DapH/DapD/GlmU-related protein [Sphingobacterium sp. HMA12]|uniref:acyltransferase n=1 Tax=Sphingobacterium sp. HMA12 TaxID=2050894 RepID=UPI000CEA4DA3|nr:acyltransferase [Sphingobacterium sp. HMA12]
MIRKFVQILKKYSMSHEEYGRFLGVKIGKGCSIKTRNFGMEPYLIEIGNNVQVTNGVSFYNHGGAWVLRDKYPDFDFFGKIKIGNNVYIGNYVLIMPGVTIGDNVIIGAGSIVTKSIPADSVAVGVPARVVSSLTEYEKRVIPFNVNTKSMTNDEKRAFLLKLDDAYFVKK